MTTQTIGVMPINKFIDNLQEGLEVSLLLLKETRLQSIYDALKKGINSQNLLPVNLVTFD